MTGEAHWITLALLAAVGVGVALLFWFGHRLAERYRAIRRHYYCDTRKQEVQLTAIQDSATGQVTGITSCTAFANPERVACDRHCVATLNQPGALEVGPDALALNVK